jgi:hypothetical protein
MSKFEAVLRTVLMDELEQCFKAFIESELWTHSKMSALKNSGANDSLIQYLSVENTVVRRLNKKNCHFEMKQSDKVQLWPGWKWVDSSRIGRFSFGVRLSSVVVDTHEP